MVASSEVVGSSAMITDGDEEMAISPPRTAIICSSENVKRSRPLSTTWPPTMRPAGRGTKRMIDSAVTDLPDPDSPTIPSVSPRRRWMLSPSTALTVPHRVVN